MLRTVAKKAATTVLSPFGLELRRAAPSPRLAAPLELPAIPTSNLSCAIIGSPQHGFSGPGKCTPGLYWPKFHYGMAKRGVPTSYHRSPAAFAREHDGGTPTIAVLVYSEEQGHTDLDELEKLEGTSSVGIVNSARIGRIIGDKTRTNDHLTERGVRMPRIMSKGDGSLIFSNENFGSTRPTRTVQRPEPGRYNTAFIDTRQPFRGKDYHWTVRALAVGGRCLSAYARLRAASEVNPSVHARNTPLDPDLINHFQRELLKPRLPEIADLCRRVADALGLGFYVHDLLICSDTGQIYLCETGFKFDDYSYRDHLWPISPDLPGLESLFSLDLAMHAATALLDEMWRLGNDNQTRASFDHQAGSSSTISAPAHSGAGRSTVSPVRGSR